MDNLECFKYEEKVGLPHFETPLTSRRVANSFTTEDQIKVKITQRRIFSLNTTTEMPFKRKPPVPIDAEQNKPASSSVDTPIEPSPSPMDFSNAACFSAMFDEDDFEDFRVGAKNRPLTSSSHFWDNDDENDNPPSLEFTSVASLAKFNRLMESKDNFEPSTPVSAPRKSKKSPRARWSGGKKSRKSKDPGTSTSGPRIPIINETTKEASPAPTKKCPSVQKMPPVPVTGKSDAYQSGGLNETVKDLTSEHVLKIPNILADPFYNNMGFDAATIATLGTCPDRDITPDSFTLWKYSLNMQSCKDDAAATEAMGKPVKIILKCNETHENGQNGAIKDDLAPDRGKESQGKDKQGKEITPVQNRCVIFKENDTATNVDLEDRINTTTDYSTYADGHSEIDFTINLSSPVTPGSGEQTGDWTAASFGTFSKSWRLGRKARSQKALGKDELDPHAKSRIFKALTPAAVEHVVGTKSELTTHTADEVVSQEGRESIRRERQSSQKDRDSGRKEQNSTQKDRDSSRKDRESIRKEHISNHKERRTLSGLIRRVTGGKVLSAGNEKAIRMSAFLGCLEARKKVDSLMRKIVTKRLHGTVINGSDGVLRSTVPARVWGKVFTHHLAIKVRGTGTGCDVFIRRRFSDGFRITNQEFEWLCTEMHSLMVKRFDVHEPVYK